MTIVPMRETHLDALAALERLCFPHPWSRETLAEELKNPAALFLVAEEDGEALGYAGLHRALDEAYMDNVAVFPRHRRRGAARALLLALEEQAREGGASFLSLEVRPSNAPALALYESLGYLREGRRKDFYSEPKEDALILTKRWPYADSGN